MITVRRWYIYLVCAVSLQSVAWAVIALLRNLLVVGGRASKETIAFQIAIIIVGLPIYLAHWLWAGRLANKDGQEVASAVRRLYLYGMLGAFLAPFLANAYGLIENILRLSLEAGSSRFSFWDDLVFNMAPMVVTTVLWYYHFRIVKTDAESNPESGPSATVRRLYIYGFSAAGLVMTTSGLFQLFQWLMFQFGDKEIIDPGDGSLAPLVALLIVGLSLWVVFWNWAQRLFNGNDLEEHESVLRKFYLYVTLFIAILATVASGAFILAGLFRRVLSLPSSGDIREPLSVIFTAGLLWIYHERVLRQDALQASEAPRQAGIRRLYLYLMAAVGLGAFLIGLGGDISVLIRSFADRITTEGLKEQLAWFTASLIAGLPVWVLPWRQGQRTAEARTPEGVEERRSLVRKIYLYFYLFVATMTVLSGAVYIVYQLISLLLGVSIEGNLLSDLGQAIAYTLIGLGVWLYHGSSIRGDSSINRQEQLSRLVELRLVILDTDDGRFGAVLLQTLKNENPQLSVFSIGLTIEAAKAMETAAAQDIDMDELKSQLKEAELIIGPWTIVLAGQDRDEISSKIAAMIVNSPARKLLIPQKWGGWDWIGIEHWEVEELVGQSVGAVKQIARGEDIKPARPLSAGAIVGIIAGALILLFILFSVVANFF